MDVTAETTGRDQDLLRPEPQAKGNTHPDSNGECGVRGTGPGRQWTVADSAKIYGIHNWGNGYFSVNKDGHVTVQPTQDPAKSIDLKKLVDELRERDIQIPVLVRFTDILQHRVGQIHNAFTRAIKENDYKGEYRCVYPIKVNQQRHVVEEIHSFGKPYGFGLEAGSKPELLAIMGIVDDDNTPIICNGFKDDEFIEAVILATKIGRNIIPVVEKFSELELIVKYAKLHNVKPSIGVRVKLAARWRRALAGVGRRALEVRPVRVGGDRRARVPPQARHGRLPQPPALSPRQPDQQHPQHQRRDHRAGRVYTELQRLGAGLKYIDVGGGLGVDYDGSKTDFGSSINYGLQEYANDVVFHVKEICDQAGVDTRRSSASPAARWCVPQPAGVQRHRLERVQAVRHPPAAHREGARGSSRPRRQPVRHVRRRERSELHGVLPRRARLARRGLEPLQPRLLLARAPQPRGAAVLRHLLERC
jgi:hypothetical protein